MPPPACGGVLVRPGLTPALLVICIVYLSWVPCFDARGVEVALFDIPVLLVMIWFRWQHAVLFTLLGAVVGLLIWGTGEPNAWAALYANTGLLVLFILVMKRTFPALGLSVVGLSYWIVLGAPLTFLMFWQQHIDTDYALAAAGQRLFSGILAITITTAFHFVMVLIQHRLPNILFGGSRRFRVRMREIAETSAILAAAVPMLLLLWLSVTNRVETEIDKLFAASEARFESLALTAAANLTEQRAVLTDISVLIPSDPPTTDAEAKRLDNLLLDTLGIDDALGYVVIKDADAEPYISSGLGLLEVPSEKLTSALGVDEPPETVQLGADEQGLIGYILSPSYPKLMVVFDSPLSLWDALYRGDMLGLMGSQASGGMIDRVSHFHGPSTQDLYGIADDAHVVRRQYDYAIWIPPARESFAGKTFKRVGEFKNSYITFQASDQLIASFDRQLYDVDCFRYTLDFWSYIRGALTSLTVWVFVGAVFLLIMACLIEFAVGRFSKPFQQLIDAMQHFNLAPAGTTFRTFEFDNRNTTTLFQKLATGFNSMEESVNTAAARLLALNANYEGLLDKARLGFIAQAADGEVAYINTLGETLLAQAPGLLDQLDAAMDGHGDITPVTVQGAGQRLDLLASQSPRQNMKGASDGRWLILSDISSLRAAERELLQAQRMSTLGQLTTGMAHEINQPLQAIKLSLANVKNTLKDPISETPRVQEKLHNVDGSLHRISELIDFMKTYGGSLSTDEQSFDPAGSVEAAISDWTQEHPDSLIIDFTQSPEISNIMLQGNSQQLKTVVRHLIKNSADAARQNKSGSDCRVGITSRVEDSQWMLVVSDDCGGFQPDTLAHIFDPFFTTKGPDEGMGLGLSVSYGIVTSMGGQLSAREVPDGAELTLCVPIVQPQG